MENLQVIKNEYSKPSEQRDYFLLNNLLKNISFFSKLQKGVRSGILESCEYFEFEA